MGVSPVGVPLSVLTFLPDRVREVLYFSRSFKGFGAWGFGFGVYKGLGFRVSGLGLGVWGLGFRV